MMRPLAHLLGIVSIAIAGALPAQLNTIAPRSCHAMAYSPAAGGVITIGGARVCGVDVLADTAVWLWDGSRWRMTASPFPSGREDALMTFDSRHHVMVLYGGRMAGMVYTDTWQLDGRHWRRRAAAAGTSPGAVEHAALGFDERRGRAVLFGGGSRDGRMFDTTWEWDGSAWLRASPKTMPAARVGHSMAWSAQDGAVLMYGGFNAKGPFRDLWKWDGATWTQLDSSGPAFTEGPALVAGDSVPMVVGSPIGAATGTLGVWMWKGGGWVRADSGSGPPARVGQGVAYDPVRRRLVVFGGSDPTTDRPSGDTWEFDGGRWRLANSPAR